MIAETSLPADRERALLVGRVWIPSLAGPALVRVDGDGLFDLSSLAPTSPRCSSCPTRLPRCARARGLPRIASRRRGARQLAAEARDPAQPWLLAPCDLQAMKAAGVTFVASMLERVIEEQARGDPAKAEAVRRAIVAVIGDDLRAVRPGSPEAARLKEALIAQRRVVAVPRGRHRPRRRDLHQVAADVGGGHRRGDRHPSASRSGTIPSRRSCSP